ncbi:MAG: ABC transporter ATP-binding protein [Oscillospiraceae bacterium]
MKTNTGTLRWILKISRKYMPVIILLSIISAIVAVINVGLALVSRRAIDIAIGSMSGSLANEFLSIFAIIVFQLVLSIVSSYLRARVTGKLDIALKNEILTSYLDKQYSKTSKFHSGEIINRFTSDIDIVVSGIVGIIPNTVSLFAKIVSGLAVLIYLDPVFALIIAIAGTSLAFVGRFYNVRYKRLHKKCQETSGVIRSFLQECVENIVVIKTFSNKIPVLNKLKSSMKENYNYKIKRNTMSIFANTGVFILFTFGYYATLAWGVFQVAGGIMTFGTLTAFLQIVSQIRAPFYNMSGLLPQYYSTVASAERLIELEDLESEPTNDNFHACSAYSKSIALKVKNLSFSYDKEKIFDNTSLTVAKNSIVSIIGISGIGKSTLFKLILGLFEPTEGELYLDCDTEIIPLNATTRSLFAYVPQGNLILSGTIRENIAFSDDAVDEQRIYDAARSADIYDFICSLPEGLDTVLGERGLGLSEGQVQRIAIARALVSDAPILLFDECTSSLDEATEQRILSNVKTLNTRTVIFISHKPAALSVCDKIYLLDNKKFTEKQIQKKELQH